MNSKRIREISDRNSKALAARTGEAEVPKFNPPPSFITPAEAEAVAAIGRAFFLAGAAGANANVNHPMRASWEAMRAYLVAAGQLR